MGKRNMVLVVGLDGATFDVLWPLLEQDKLPSISALLQSGCWGRLRSTIPPFTAPAWASFITGRNPGGHGILSFQIRDRFTYDVSGGSFVDARCFEETLWDILTQTGKRIGTVNVPLTYPPPHVNGFAIAGMLTPPGAREYTYPPELVASLGDYVIDLDYQREKGGQFRVSGFPPLSQVIADVQHMTRIGGQVCLRLMKEWDLDFFMVVFVGTDRILHFCWEHLVARGTRAAEDGIRKEIYSYFEELDGIIGRLVEQAGPSATTIIMSDHGFGPAPRRRVYLNVWLKKLGLLHLRHWSKNALSPEYVRILLGQHGAVKTLLQKFIPRQVQDSVEKATQRMRNDVINWSKTLAYYVPLYFHVCGIEINLRGRHRNGFVDPGQEYETLREKIIAEATQLVDPQTGRTIVQQVYRREELYRGPYTSDFPDIIIVLDPLYAGASSLATDSLVEPILFPFRSGEHRQEGIFIAAGPQICRQVDLKGLNLLDVPPTLLYLLGLPVPLSFDGRVLEEIFRSEFLEAHPVVRSALSVPAKPVDLSSAVYSDEETKTLEKRLRGLGYID